MLQNCKKRNIYIYIYIFFQRLKFDFFLVKCQNTKMLKFLTLQYGVDKILMLNFNHLLKINYKKLNFYTL